MLLNSKKNLLALTLLNCHQHLTLLTIHPLELLSSFGFYNTTLSSYFSDLHSILQELTFLQQAFFFFLLEATVIDFRNFFPSQSPLPIVSTTYIKDSNFLFPANSSLLNFRMKYLIAYRNFHLKAPKVLQTHHVRLKSDLIFIWYHHELSCRTQDTGNFSLLYLLSIN